MESNIQLEKDSILKLIIKFSLPAFIALLVNSIYNIVDRVFIGQFVGEEALAGLTIAYPIMYIVFAGCVLIGRGGANLISLKLGEKNHQDANILFTTTISMSVILAVILITVGMITLDPIMNLLATEKTVTLFAKNYLKIIYFGILFQIMAFTLNSIVRAEGFPIVSMVSMLVSAITNIVLDYIFIAILGMGVSGAALATIIGQLLGLIVLIYHFLKKKSNMSFLINQLLPKTKVIKEILKIGSPSFVVTLGSGVAMMLLTASLSKHGGTAAVASMGAIGSLSNLFIIPVLGIQNGIQPIIGYNYGAKKFNRVRSILINSIILGIGISSIVFSLLRFYPSFFIGLFLKDHSTALPLAIRGLEIYSLTLPIISINMIGSGYFQSIAKSRKALITGGMRQIIFLLPLLIIFPNLWGLTGVWMATPVADFIAIIITLLYLIPEYLKLNASPLTTQEAY